MTIPLMIQCTLPTQRELFSLFTKFMTQQKLPTVLCIQQILNKHLNKLIHRPMLSTWQEICSRDKKKKKTQLLTRFSFSFTSVFLSVSLSLCTPMSLSLFFFIWLSSFLTSREKLKWPQGNFSSLHTRIPSRKIHLIYNHNTYNWVS